MGSKMMSHSLDSLVGRREMAVTEEQENVPGKENDMFM